MATVVAGTGGLQRTGQGFQFTRAYLALLAAQAMDETPDAGSLFECDCRLFTNAEAPGSSSVIADFTAPTWTGYTDRTEISSWDVGMAGTGGVILAATFANWEVGASPDATVWGYILLKGTLLIGGEILSAAIVPQVGQLIHVIPEIQFGVLS